MKEIARRLVGNVWRTGVVEEDGNGGSQSWQFISFPFTHATPGLDVGVTVFTPAVGQILYDAWIEVLIAFDGTTPKADVSQWLGTQNFGMFGWPTAPYDLTNADSIEDGTDPNFYGGPSFGGDHAASYSMGAVDGNTHRDWGHFTTTDPLKLIATQNGQRGGAAINSTVGSAILRLLILTP